MSDNLTQKRRTILEEISAFVPNKSRADHIEARAQHIISSAINLLESIDSSFDVESAELLKRRFLASVKNGEPEKFIRAVRRLKE